MVGNKLEEKIQPVYIFSGDDAYSKNKLEKDIEDRLNAEYGGCLLTVLDAKEHEYSKIITEVLNPSLFADIGLVIIKRGDQLLSNKEFVNFLIKYSTNANPANIIIIETEKKKTVKNLKIISMDTPYENRIPGWIKRSFSEHDKQIADDAANLLTFYCGRNLYSITKEIEKILTAYPDKGIYHVEEIKSIAGSHKKSDIFGYLNALESFDMKRALILLEELIKYGTEPVNIIGMLRWKLQQMLTAKALMNKGIKEKDVISKMRLSPYLYRGFCSRLNKFSLDKIFELYNSLYQTDLQLKTTGVNKYLLLEKFTFQFLAN